MIKIIQIVREHTDFQSQILTYEKSWIDFCEIIQKNIGKQDLAIENIEGLKIVSSSENPILLLTPFVQDYIFLQKDSNHLMIETYSANYGFDIRRRKEIMFQVVEEMENKPLKTTIFDELFEGKTFAELDKIIYASSQPKEKKYKHNYHSLV